MGRSLLRGPAGAGRVGGSRDRGTASRSTKPTRREPGGSSSPDLLSRGALGGNRSSPIGRLSHGHGHYHWLLGRYSRKCGANRVCAAPECQSLIRSFSDRRQQWSFLAEISGDLPVAESLYPCAAVIVDTEEIYEDRIGLGVGLTWRRSCGPEPPRFPHRSRRPQIHV